MKPVIPPMYRNLLGALYFAYSDKKRANVAFQKAAKLLFTRASLSEIMCFQADF